MNEQEIERIFREEYGRAVAVLIRRFGDIDLAEEPVQDTVEIATRDYRRRRDANVFARPVV